MFDGLGRRDIFKQSARFLTDAGAKLESQPNGTEVIVNETVPVIELGPLVSYDGEGLVDVVKGKTIVVKKPLSIQSLDDLKKVVC
jgi:hypothetical protein